MDLLRPRVPRHVRDGTHGEWLAVRTVALHSACDSGYPRIAMRPVGRWRRWRWYAVTPYWFEGADLPITDERIGRAWTQRGAKRAALHATDPARPVKDAVRLYRYLGLGRIEALAVRALNVLGYAGYVLAAIGVVLLLGGGLGHHDRLVRVGGALVLLGCFGGMALHILTRAHLARRAPAHTEEIR